MISVCSTTSTPMVMMAAAMIERGATGRTNSRSTTSGDDDGHGDAEQQGDDERVLVDGAEPGREVGADHQQAAVGEVHDLGGPEHDDEPEGEQRVDGAECGPAHEQLQQLVHQCLPPAVVAIVSTGSVSAPR